MNIIAKYILCFILLAFSAIELNAQSRKEIQQKKTQIQRELDYTDQLLDNPQGTTYSVNAVRVIDKKIAKRQLMIRTIAEEIKLIDKQIAQNNDSIAALESKLTEIRKEYEKLITIAYKNRKSMNFLMFILSSESFNQSYKRFLYLKQYTNFRKHQVEQILATQELLTDKNNELQQIKKEKQQLINQKQQETQKLSHEKKEQANAIITLRKNEPALRKKAEKKREVRKKLNNKLDKVVSSTPAATSEKAKTYKSEKSLTAQFRSNKGKMPWPVSRGVVIVYFGKQEHPVFKGVMIRNDGIDISTKKGMDAKTVYNGVVSSVVAIPGANNTVLINHGDYFTMYSNLEKVYVKAGERVSQGQKLGMVFTDKADNNLTLLKFQIWENGKKQNPMRWLKRK